MRKDMIENDPKRLNDMMKIMSEGYETYLNKIDGWLWDRNLILLDSGIYGWSSEEELQDYFDRYEKVCKRKHFADEK